MAYLYILRCTDGSLYTGITSDIRRRLCQHMRIRPGGARYTRAHPVCHLAGLWLTQDLSLAAKLEYAVKRLRRQHKLLLLAEPQRLGRPPFGDAGGALCRPLPLLPYRPFFPDTSGQSTDTSS